MNSNNKISINVNEETKLLGVGRNTTKNTRY